MINDFDRFFLHLPPLDKENDFFSFWDNSFSMLKKIPIEPIINLNDVKGTDKFHVYDTYFNGSGKYKVKGELHIPVNTRKPKVIIYIHDYNSPVIPAENHLDEELAYFFIQLRGHEYIFNQTILNNNTKNNNNKNKEERKSPGFIIENILEKDDFYIKDIFLDVFRSIDFLRLVKEIDCGSMAIIGKGLGAAAAVFASGYSDRIRTIVLDTPSFCYLDLSQNISRSDATNEINSFLTDNRSKTKAVKSNLTYFDAINHSDKIKIPILVIVGLKDTLSPPECVFALFNHMQCEKTVEVYPEEDNSAGGNNQLKKSIEWIKQYINN
ncbi:MAG: acetylxylan esterase [Spirochaetes bacterium]|nr:acetylxylan esterase [Spirochaetota bacterium]